MVNADPIGLGNSFEDTVTHLMLVDPVEAKIRPHKTLTDASISSTLAGKDETGVDLHLYKKMNLNK